MSKKEGTSKQEQKKNARPQRATKDTTPEWDTDLSDISANRKRKRQTNQVNSKVQLKD